MQKYSDLEMIQYWKDIEVRVILQSDNTFKIKNRCIHDTKKEPMCGECMKLIQDNYAYYLTTIEEVKSSLDKISGYRLTPRSNP